MKPLLVIAVIILSLKLNAQEYTLAYRNTPSSVQLKWYGPELFSGKEFHVFRKAEGGDWEKLTAQPVKLGSKQPGAAEHAADKELKDYVKLASSGKKPEGIALLLLTMKTFKSNALSSYLGIFYEDTKVPQTGRFQYKLMVSEGGSLKELKTTAVFDRQEVIGHQPVDSVAYELKKKGVKFKWKSEPSRFYGVNIYRSGSKDSLGSLATPEPVLISKIKNEKGELTLPDFYFQDEKLEEKKEYYYTFAGIDLFGEEIGHTVPLKIRIKDDTPPLGPTNLEKEVYDKKVALRWEHLVKDEDQTEYHLYVTQMNDTIFYREESVVIPLESKTYEFMFPRYGTYGLKVAAVDQEGNTGFSNIVYIEILDKIAPEPPSNVHIVADTGRLEIRWDRNKENDIAGYKIYRSIQGKRSALTLLTADLFPEPHFTDSLPANAINSFTYSVLAIDSSGNESKLSEPASKELIDATPPKAPFLKNIVLQDELAVVQWVRNTELDLAGYKVERRDLNDSLASFEQLNINLLPIDVNEFRDRFVEEGHKYVYRVSAADKKNNFSAPSNEVRFELRNRPEKTDIEFKNVTAKYSKATGTVRLRWSTKKEEEELSFVVFKKTEGQLKPVSGMQKDFQFTDRDVKKGEKIEYQVRVYDSKGRSSRSDIYELEIPKTKE